MRPCDGTWDFGDLDVYYCNIEYDRYGDEDEEEIIKKEIRRIRRNYREEYPGRKIEVEYHTWYDEILVCLYRTPGDKMMNETIKAMNFIYDTHLWVSNEPGMLRRIIIDDSIKDHVPQIERPSGRADIITYLTSNKHVEAIPEFREIVLHDDSLFCRHEAIKGLFKLGADASVFAEAAKNLPFGVSEDHETYREAVFVLAGARGVPEFREYIKLEAEAMGILMSPHKQTLLIGEDDEPQTDDDSKF